MKYKAEDRVRAKSLDWYNENKNKFGKVWTSGKGGQIPFDKDMSKWCGKVMTISDVRADHYTMIEDLVGYWTDEMIEGLVEEEVDLIPKFGEYSDNEPLDMGEVSDGYHTFNELYEYRMLYNAALFNEFAKQGLYDVHKSRKHSDGEYPFGDSNWFIVMAELPTGQISNHYEMKDWDKFQIPEKPLANKWDEHSPRDVAERLTNFTTPKKKYPKTFEECVSVIMREGGGNRMSLELMNTFRKLIDARNAYWKLYGEEMGLGKSWEPDWLDDDTKKYVITSSKVFETFGGLGYINYILTFPTEEMRDAFYENFKELIEQCKELL